MNEPRPVPSLEAIAADPTLAEALPPDAVRTLAAKAAVVLASLLAVRGGNGAHDFRQQDADVVLDYAGVAAFLGVSRSWVEKHIADLPPRRSLAGTPRWLKSELEKWIRNRPKYGSR
jgi:predicted DNA-binding transcriptional regulator AlpA